MIVIDDDFVFTILFWTKADCMLVAKEFPPLIMCQTRMI